ncbi:hypothetical protein LCGC14_1989210 [marine sediment metagenome]|uniref:Uncharacterized protein n=1 Tax=marine sediment metagenome TaxID=412755 RepID=A0A0F9F6S8_9ZZZZ
MKRLTKTALLALIVVGALSALAIPAEKPGHKAGQEANIRALQQGLRLQRQVMELMADPLMAAHVAISRIKELAAKGKQPEQAVHALYIIGKSDTHPAIKRSALLAASELLGGAGKTPEAIEALVMLCRLSGEEEDDEDEDEGDKEEVAEQANWLCENIGAGGGHILSTCNILTNSIPAANARAMYGAGMASS